MNGTLNAENFLRTAEANGPAYDGFVITPSDTVNFEDVAKAIYVGGAGNISLVTPKGTVLTFVGIPVGTTLWVCAARVNASLTTATNLIGLL
jgi:hypothetical protein